MTARPSDWSPLGYGSDPVPGDPEEVADEARHYGRVAREISSQVRRLRRLADPDDALQGDYAPALQEACEELADDVEKAHGRFETVSTQLNLLHPAHETAQTETKAALEDARTSQTTIDQVDAKGWTFVDLADPENTEAQADDRARDAATIALGAARTRAERAVNAYDGVATRVAREIRNASDDKLKDGRFEGVKAWVKKHADLLRQISKILGAIVLVLAVAIILLSNPAGWLVLAAIVAGAALLTVDVLLAASGEGSWADVALDVVGLLTLGTGSLAGKLVKFGRSMTLFKAGNQGGLAAARAVLTGAFNGTGRFARITNVVNRVRPSTYVAAARSYVTEFKAARAFQIPAGGLSTVGRWPFSREATHLADDLAAITEKFGPDVVTGLHKGALPWLQGASGIGAVNTALDALLNKAPDFDIPVIGDWGGRLDDLTTREISSL